MRRSPLLALLLLIPLGASAQIYPPAPGVDMPQAYFERRAADRTAFTFQRAWFGKVERAREARVQIELGLGHKLGPEANPVVSGNFYVPVIAGKFANTVSDPYTPTQLQNQLFDGPNPTGTIPDYYDEISYGALNMIGSVYTNGSTYYQVSQNDTFYEGPPGCNGLCGSSQVGVYLQELLDLSDGSVDFGLYDNDGPDGIPNSGDDDGFVDFVAFVHPEAGGECGNDNIWSHRWVYDGWWGAPYTTNDVAAGGGFIRVSDYTIQPLLACNGSSLIEIGVYAHEFGHAFGLPDLYDTNSSNGTSQGIGQWGLMGSGSYGGDGLHSDTPTHMCAWSKEQLGWVTPTVVCDPGSFALPDVETTGEVLKIYPQGIAGTEYWLIENRVQTGFDTYLYTSGLAVWHIDNDQAGNGDENMKLVDLEEADGLAQLDNNLNRGDAGDLYPGSTNKTVFNSVSNPNSNDNSGAVTAMAMTNVGVGSNPRGFDLVVPDCILRLADTVVDDSECGSNDGAVDSNERFSLQLCVANDFSSSFTGITGVLSSTEPNVLIHQDTVSYGSVDPGIDNCGGATFDVEITSALSNGQALDFTLTLSGDGGYNSIADFTLYGGDYILLVEDDGAAGYSIYYRNAIANSGYSWVWHNVDLAGMPGAGLMASSLATVWYTGEAYEGTFTPAEQAAVSNYLDNGGRLFVSGQDIGYDLVGQGDAADLAFYTDYLHAEYLSDDTNDNTLTGVVGDVVGNGLSLTLTSNANNNTFPDLIDPVGGAFPVFRYSGLDEGAVRYDGAYRNVYFGFNFEAAATSQQNSTMFSILNYLVPSDYTAPAMTLTAPLGGENFAACNPMNIVWSASDANGITEVELFVSQDGGSSWAPIVTLPGNPGSYLWNSPLLDATARIKVIARDPSGLQGVDISGDFTIADTTPPTVTVTSPNGGESWAVGSNQLITWTSSDDCSGTDLATIQLSRDDGANWTELGSVPAIQESLPWIVTAPDSDINRIRVLVLDNSANEGSDDSDLVFEIQSGAPQVNVAVSVASPLPVSLLSHPDGSGFALSEAWDWNGVVGSTPTPTDATITLVFTDGGGSPIAGYPAANVGVQSSAGGWSQCAGSELHGDADADGSGSMAISGALYGMGASGLGELLEITVNDPNLNSISYPGGAAGLDIRVNSVDINSDGISNLVDVSNFALDFNGAYAYRSDFSWNGLLNLPDIGRLSFGIQTTCPAGPLAPPQFASEGDEIGLYFDGAGTVKAIAAEPGEVFTAYLMLRGPAASGGVLAWEAKLEPSDNLEIVGSTLPAGAVDAGDELGFVVGTGSKQPVAKTGAPMLLATLQLRALDDRPAQLKLRGVSAESPLLADAREQLLTAGGDPEAPIAFVNDRSVDASGRFLGYALGNHPNPFNPSTQIHFNLPRTGAVTLRIHDVAGRLVTELDAGELAAGAHELHWGGTDRRGARVNSGIYFAMLFVDGRRVGEPSKMSLLK